jgi:hypothetical protein
MKKQPTLKDLSIPMTDQELNEAVARKLELNLGNLKARDYCNSIAAAWEIITHLQGQSLQMRMMSQKDWTDILIFDPDALNNVNLATGQANTAPRAICEAFLKLP